MTNKYGDLTVYGWVFLIVVGTSALVILMGIIAVFITQGNEFDKFKYDLCIKSEISASECFRTYYGKK